jgi:hypothetical protein
MVHKSKCQSPKDKQSSNVKIQSSNKVQMPKAKGQSEAGDWRLVEIFRDLVEISRD